jgi:uncharacterized protein YtpQ (UPF0354 family)
MMWARSRLWLVALLTLTLAVDHAPGSAQTARDPVVEAARGALVKRLENSPALAKLTVVDPMTLKGIGQNGVEVTISLDNLVAEWRTKPAQRADLVDRFARTIETTMRHGLDGGAPALSPEAFRAALRPVIRHTSMLEQSRAAATANPGQTILSWPLAGEALILVAVDGAENVRMVSADEAKTQAMSPDAVLARATENARALLAGLKVETSRSFVSVSVEEDYYSAAMLLLPETRAAIEKALGPGFVVLIPDRNTVIAAKPGDGAALIRAGQEIARQRRAPLLIPHLIQHSGDGWRVSP